VPLEPWPARFEVSIIEHRERDRLLARPLHLDEIDRPILRRSHANAECFRLIENGAIFEVNGLRRMGNIGLMKDTQSLPGLNAENYGPYLHVWIDCLLQVF